MSSQLMGNICSCKPWQVLGCCVQNFRIALTQISVRELTKRHHNTCAVLLQRWENVRASKFWWQIQVIGLFSLKLVTLMKFRGDQGVRMGIQDTNPTDPFQQFDRLRPPHSTLTLRSRVSLHSSRKCHGMHCIVCAGDPDWGMQH